jgi:oligopeptide/dipeptide ABC transporter ATP-binding protein
MSSLLSVRDLKVRYPVGGGLGTVLKKDQPTFVDVVHGVSMDINRGETIAVVGESGSGKTTLAMALCGLAPVLDGVVEFDGQAVDCDKRGFLKPDRRKIALMFQDPIGSLSPRMMVRKLLAEPFCINGMASSPADEKALNLLDMVGLGHDFADRYPHQLSGGQARRVCVARALALEPELLIADEPTAGLDVSVQGEVLNLLTSLQQKMGLGIMIITHNLNIVRHVAGEMAIMYLGRFVEQGDSQNIFDHPRHPYTAALLSANPSSDPDAAIDRIELTGEVPGLLHRPTGCEFHTRCPHVQQKCRDIFPKPSSLSGQQSFKCYFPLP